MLRYFAVLLLGVFGSLTLVHAQAPGMPLVPAATTGGTRFFIEGDVEWASIKVNGNVAPTQYDKSFLPQLTLGWNMAADNAVLVSYRYDATQVSDVFNLDMPDMTTYVHRKMNLQTADLAYRERLGGPDAPLGMEVDMGFRFAWAKFQDDINANYFPDAVNTQRELGFLTGGTRIGIKPYWTFDQSAWRMTLYAQAHLAYLWGTFHSQSWQNSVSQTNARDNSTLFNWDAEAGFSMYLPGMEGVLQLTAGYRYEVWSVDRLGFITSSDSGKLTQYGPFLRLQLSF